MNDAGEPLVGKQLRHRVSIREVDLLEAERRLLSQQRQPGSLEADVVIVIEVVEPHDLVTSREQAERRVIADKSRGSGNQDFKIRHLSDSSPVLLEEAMSAKGTCRRSPWQ